MAHYVYEGQHFELPDGLSNEEAIGKIKTHLGQKVDTKKEKTTIAEDLDIGLQNIRNTGETALDVLTAPLLAGYAKLRGKNPEDYFGASQKLREERLKKASGGKEQTFGGKAISMIPQLAAFPSMMALSPLETMGKFAEQGESIPRALGAGAVDALGNALGMFTGPVGSGIVKRAATGAAMNAAQDTAARAAISAIAENKSTKELFDPTLETAGLAGLVGGGFGALSRKSPEKAIEVDKITKLREAYKAKTEKPQEPVKLPEVMIADEAGNAYPKGDDVDFWKQRAEKMQAEADLELLKKEQPDMVAEAMKPDEDAAKATFEKLAAEETAAKQAQMEEMWQQRRPEQVVAEEARAREKEQETIRLSQLQELEQSLLPERVSKGQQRKMNRGMARGQRGAFLFGDSDKVDKVHDILQDTKSYISEDIPVDKAIAASKGEADTGPKTNTFGRYFGSGGVSEAMKRNSTMVLAGVRYVQNATKRADLFNRTMVKPFEDAVRKLDDSTITSFAELLKDEALGKFTYDLADLQKVFTPEQLVAYQNFRKADKAAYEMQNAERTRMGKKPIPYNEWHVASRWEGDHRQPVKIDTGELNKDGTKKYKIVSFLAADTKWGLEAQMKTLQKKHPEYIMDVKDRVLIKGSRRFAEGVDVDKAYSLALDLLGRDDPAVQKFAELYEQTLQETTRMTAGQEKHFKRKAGVGGFVGDRPDLTFDIGGREFTKKRNKASEARAYMQQQVNYLKNAAKWTEMQKAGESIKQLTSDPELAKEQPNNSAYLMDYWKTNLGFNESAGAKLVDDAFRAAGISPAAVNSAVGSTKTFFILQKLALSPGYIASNLLQTTAVLPYLMDLRAKGYKSNPLTAIASAMPLGIMMAHGHWGRVLGKEMDLPLSRMLGSMDEADATFYSKALRFAEDNGTVSRSSYDESPIDSGRNAATQAVDVAGKLTMAYPESIIRSIAYFSYVDMLKQSGKYKGDDMALFQHADELVSMSMVDYRQGERPMMFQKMGTFGNLANTLQTYPISFYNQWIYFAKEARKGNMAPIMMATALQGSLAGLMGLPFVSDLDKLYQTFKDWIPAKQWAQIKGTPLEDPKLWLMSQPGGLELVNGLLSSHSGVAMTSRVAAPSFAEMAQAPVGPLQDIGRQIGDVASLLGDPMDPTKQAQAAMSVSPVATQGLVEQKMFPEQTGTDMPDGKRAVFNARELEKRDQVYTRTPADQDIRNWGVRSNAEVVSKEAYYRTDRLKQITNEKTSAVANKLYAAIRSGNREKAHDMLELMVELSGKAYTPAQLKQQLQNEFMSKEMKELMGAKTPSAIARMKLMQEVLERVREEETE